MSRRVCVQFEVRNALIMKDTLKQMGIDYTENRTNVFQISDGYRGMTINAENNTMTYDNMNVKRANEIKQQYMRNYYKDQAIREGMQFKEEVNSKGEIILHLYHS